MHKLTIIVATALAAMFATEADAQRWTSRGDVATAAHRFDDAMNRFNRVLDQRRVDWRLERDVQRLDLMIQRFHRAVERGVDAQRLNRLFDRVERQFHDVRSQVRYELRGDRRLLVLWRRAAQEFHDLQAVMGQFDVRDYVHPHDDYYEGPYYRERYHEPEVHRYQRRTVPAQPQQRQTYRWYWRWPG